MKIKIWWNWIRDSFKRLSADQVLSLIFELIIVAATTSYAVIALLQWSAMKNTLDETRKLATAAEKANELTRKIAIDNERPWIGLYRVSISNIEVGKRPVISLVFTNFGKTPSTNTRLHNGMGLVDGNPSATDIMKKIDTMKLQQLGTIFPGGTPTNDTTMGIDLTNEILADVNKGRLFIYQMGKIIYQDSAGREHHTWFAFPYAPDVKAMAVFRPPDLPPDD